MTIRILQVHQLAPIKLRVLTERGLLAPSRMIRPKFLANVGQFEPGVYKNRITVAGFDQFFQVFILRGIGIGIVPGCDVQSANSRLPPAFGEIIDVRA